jgi:hypothetical protein
VSAGVQEAFGPIDFVVVEFPSGSTDFDREAARELLSLVDNEMIRILDVLIIDKDDEGQTEAFELEDLGEGARLRALDHQLAEILSAEDVPYLAAAMEPGTMAGVLIWENRWAAPFAAAAQSSGAVLIASGRISPQAAIDALGADLD